MPADPGQLPHLVRLLDDPSDANRAVIADALGAFGPGLYAHLEKLDPPPDGTQRGAMHDLLAPWRRQWVQDAWGGWQEMDAGVPRLEAAMSLLSNYLSGCRLPGRLTPRLDELADGFARDDAEAVNDPRNLARWLFARPTALRGATPETYFQPGSSDLRAVIDGRSGNPISLCTVYILVGDRLGMRIRGCNFPAHFLALAWPEPGDAVIVDCFDGGETIDEERFQALQRSSRSVSFDTVLQMEADCDMIIQRVLRNLAAAFQRTGSKDDVGTMVRLLERTGNGLPAIRRPVGEVVEAEAYFEPGMLVRHRRYNYRGVVVSRDESCQADELWYRGNRTQPEREQPWYHVLVDQTDAVTYAAQSSLAPDDTDESIQHPLLAMFFFEPAPGRYVRNERPWPPEQTDS